MGELLAHRLHQVGQHVDDLQRAVSFYRDVLGLPLIAVFDPPGLAFFDLGNVRLLLEGGAPSAIVYLEVPEIDQSRAALVAKGVHFIDEPHAIFVDEQGTFGEPGSAEWMTFFRDSEDNTLALVERRRG